MEQSMLTLTSPPVRLLSPPRRRRRHLSPPRLLPAASPPRHGIQHAPSSHRRLPSSPRRRPPPPLRATASPTHLARRAGGSDREVQKGSPLSVRADHGGEEGRRPCRRARSSTAPPHRSRVVDPHGEAVVAGGDNHGDATCCSARHRHLLQVRRSQPVGPWWRRRSSSDR